jgi:hypothetical protein
MANIVSFVDCASLSPDYFQCFLQGVENEGNYFTTGGFVGKGIADSRPLCVFDALK